MRQSQLLIPTLKENPAGADVVSHQLMLRAGLIRQVAAGLYTWLPLGLRVIRKIEGIIREEMNASGAQEVLMPVVQPAELWQESGRWEKMGPEMLRMHDRHKRDFCLSPTHEELVTELFRTEIQSYRALPKNFYQLQTKFRDEIRPRFGVMRAREFTMKDGYSFDVDEEAFARTYQGMYDCYARILTRLSVDFRAVEADTGNIGGANSHEFHVLADAGEDLIAYAVHGAYAANLEKATTPAPAPAAPGAEALTKVATPGQKTIDAVSAFLQVDPDKTVKTLIVDGEEGPLALVLRGDHELNEIKAGKLAGIAQPLRMASEATVRASAGCGPGSIGPVGLKLPIIVDHAARAVADFVCGANEDDVHYTGANWERDVGAVRVEDLRNVAAGDPSPDGSGELAFLRGIEVGHIFQLGTTYTEAMGATVLDADGGKLTPIMGCYGMGVTRLVAAIIEQKHDDNGICWPTAVAPFAVHIVALNYGKSDTVRAAADKLLDDCRAAGLEALLDDRDERPGVKFADADLLGLPLRVTVGDRALGNGELELQRRTDSEKTLLPVDKIVPRLKELATITAQQ